MRDNEAEFTALERWEKEYKDYKRLVKIPTFANFRMWKAFVAVSYTHLTLPTSDLV